MIYIDNSATTKQYPQVTETMMKYMEEYFGNPSSMYQLGLDSEKAVKHARKQVEEAMGAGNGTLIFTSGGTEADNTAIFGAARAAPSWKQDHHVCRRTSGCAGML